MGSAAPITQVAPKICGELGLSATQFVLLVGDFRKHPVFGASLREVNVVWRSVSVISLVFKLSVVSHIIWPVKFM